MSRNLFLKQHFNVVDAEEGDTKQPSEKTPARQHQRQLGDPGSAERRQKSERPPEPEYRLRSKPGESDRRQRSDDETDSKQLRRRREEEQAEAASERRRQDAAVESVLERARRARQQLELELQSEEDGVGDQARPPTTTSLPVKHKTVR